MATAEGWESDRKKDKKGGKTRNTTGQILTDGAILEKTTQPGEAGTAEVETWEIGRRFACEKKRGKNRANFPKSYSSCKSLSRLRREGVRPVFGLKERVEEESVQNHVESNTRRD